MTPKEKAIELFDTYYEFDFNTVWVNKQRKLAKQCALIAVSEIIQEVYSISHQHTAIYDEKAGFYRYEECKELKYWRQVKTEIENL